MCAESMKESHETILTLHPDNEKPQMLSILLVDCAPNIIIKGWLFLYLGWAA